MTLRGTSQRGHLHRAYGVPRQDDFTMHDLPDGRVIISVADGVSQAQQAHLGAHHATRLATNWLRLNLSDNIADTDWMNLIRSTAWALNERAQRLFGLAEPDPIRTEIEFATTLICAVVEPIAPGALRAHLVGCGDSAAWILSDGRFTNLVGGKAESLSGITSSEVVGLPRVPREVAAVSVEIGPNDVLLIGSDGVGDPLGSGEGGVGNLLREALCRPSPPSLIEFAHAVGFSRETFDDDRTLVAVWPRQPWSDRSDPPLPQPAQGNNVP